MSDAPAAASVRPPPITGDAFVEKFHAMGLSEVMLVRHERVYTCEKADEAMAGKPGVGTKSLFVTDRKHKIYALLVCRDDTHFTFNEFAKKMKLPSLSLAKPERMEYFLGVTPGQCSPFTVINDIDNKVTVFLDKALCGDVLSRHHPNDNSATLIVSGDTIVSFLKQTGHEPILFDMNEKEEEEEEEKEKEEEKVEEKREEEDKNKE